VTEDGTGRLITCIS